MARRTLWEIEQAVAEAKAMSGQSRRAWLADVAVDLQQWTLEHTDKSIWPGVAPENKVLWLDLNEELAELLEREGVGEGLDS